MKNNTGGLRLNESGEEVVKAEIQLAIMKAKKSSLIEYMQKNIKKEVNIAAVRKRLSKIEGSMAAGIIENRQERI